MTTNCSFNWAEISRVTGPCVRPGGSVLTERALAVCNLPPGSRVADIGCGEGGTLEILEEAGTYRSVGLDCSEMFLGEAVPRLASGRLVRGRAEALPFRRGCLDALFCECVLSILDDKVTILDGFAGVLKEGGVLIVSDIFGKGCAGERRPQGESQGFRAEGLLVKEDLIASLERRGFSVLLWEEHERLLKEFVARMILAGVRLPDPWKCGQTQWGKKTNRPAISYFLLVARRRADAYQSVRNVKRGESWTT